MYMRQCYSHLESIYYTYKCVACMNFIGDFLLQYICCCSMALNSFQLDGAVFPLLSLCCNCMCHLHVSNMQLDFIFFKIIRHQRKINGKFFDKYLKRISCWIGYFAFAFWFTDKPMWTMISCNLVTKNIFLLYFLLFFVYRHWNHKPCK